MRSRTIIFVASGYCFYANKRLEVKYRKMLDNNSPYFSTSIALTSSETDSSSVVCTVMWLSSTMTMSAQNGATSGEIPLDSGILMGEYRGSDGPKVK